MYIYANKNLRDHYFESAVELTNSPVRRVGTTYEDYEVGAWVALSDEQLAWREAHPEASVKEVIEMQEYERPIAEGRTVAEAKADMLAKIEAYDHSDAVDGFVVDFGDGEEPIVTWLTVEQRLDYRESVKVAQVYDEDDVAFYIGRRLVTVGCEEALDMLAQIQVYANECYNVTYGHKLAVEAMDSVEEIDSYDYRADYPKQLTFNLTAHA